jgi:putative heme-binding domain-containing protein
MNGVLHVVSDEAEVTEEPLAAAPVAPARAFVRHWTIEDFAAGVPEPAGDPARGKAVLDAAGCLKCHAVDGAGGRTGPELRDVAARWDRADLLEQILQPSRNIAEGYATELFFLRGGDVVAGRVLGEDVDGVDVLDDPYREAPRRVPRASIEERRPSEVSIMPEGLLATFTREEIVSLVGYLASLRPAEAGGR